MSILPVHRRRVSALLLVLLSVAMSVETLLAARPTLAAERQPQEEPTVKLVIDFGDGVEKHFTALPWREGMTVLDAMQTAARHPRGIRFQYTGEGKTAFLTSIDDVANEGAERNWIYRVNEDRGDRSIGVKTLSINDVVYWKFGAE